MDRLRRSLRESFRRKKNHVPECSKPHQWQSDEGAVRNGSCNFHVKYLGCVEVYESRGMQVCEEALKVLRNSRRRPVKGVLYVTGDGLRVVDDDNKGLIVDQTIEKVSFCAPDRNHDRGFSYICRDGTTRRWMCHGFLASKDVNVSQSAGTNKNLGERLSHAVGCAFAVCLEKKQKRDKECGVQMTFDTNTSTFTRTGSFKQTTLTERMQDPQECMPAPSQVPPTNTSVHNPYAVQRPHATTSMLERQGSFRGFGQLNQTSPFKRQLSLRLDELPSTLERQQNSISDNHSKISHNGANKLSSDGRKSTDNGYINKNQPLSNKFYMSPIPEMGSNVESGDSISAMCQQLTQGLSMLSKNDTQPNDSTGNPWATTTLSDNNKTKWLPSGGKQHLPQQSIAPSVPPRVNSPQTKRAPHLTNLRSMSVGAEPTSKSNNFTSLRQSNGEQSNQFRKGRDPFDADWAAIATRHESSSPPPTNTKNPFQQNRIQAFEVHM